MWWKPMKHIFGVFSQCRSLKHFWWIQMESMYLCLPLVQEQYICGWCVRDLDFKSMTTSHKGQQSLTKLNAKQAAYMSGSFPNLTIIYGSGWNSSFVIQGIHHVGFLCFSKDKSLELQYHQEQDKQQLRPSHILSVNYLDLDQAYATHEFHVQSKFLYQTSRIQNLGEFKAKN